MNITSYKHYEKDRKNKKKRTVNHAKENNGKEEIEGCLFFGVIPLIALLFPLIGFSIFMVFIDFRPLFAKINGIVALISFAFWAGIFGPIILWLFN